jgi:hypothetical protein
MMNHQMAAGALFFAHLNVEEKLEYLQVLSDVVCDIRSELARAEAERAALTNSLEADLHRVPEVRDARH